MQDEENTCRRFCCGLHLTTTFSREDGVGRSQDSACGRVFESYEKTKAGHHGLESNGT